MNIAENQDRMDQQLSRKPGTFKKGDPRINRTKGPGGKRGNLSPLLRDMRWVYSRPEVQDRTPGQKHCREWLKSNPKGFLSKMADLEKALAQAEAKSGESGRKEAPKPEEEVDMGTERCIALAERLLDEWSDEESDKIEYERLKRKIEGKPSR